jgi:bifunctional UDP-N-acetylglucosamine pyrophosphorylase/glucosamine-1-phosphate N-acetyltransferase
MLDARYGAGAIDVALQVEQRGTGHAVQSALPLAGRRARRPHRGDLVGRRAAAPRRADRRADRGVRRPAPPASRSCRRCPTARCPTAAWSATAPAACSDRRARRRQRGRAGIPDCNAGFYAVRLGHLRADLASLTADNAKGELYLTDLVARAATRGGATALDAPFEEVSGINDRVDLAAVEKSPRAVGSTRPGCAPASPWRRPTQTYIDADVGAIGQDVWLGPGVCLRCAARPHRRRRPPRRRLRADRRHRRRRRVPQALHHRHRVGDRRAQRDRAVRAPAAGHRRSTTTSRSATSSRPRRRT